MPSSCQALNSLAHMQMPLRGTGSGKTRAATSSAPLRLGFAEGEERKARGGGSGLQLHFGPLSPFVLHLVQTRLLEAKKTVGVR